MGRIDDTLRMRSMFAMAGGGTFTDADLWTKAFRLKQFGRCPWCDKGVECFRDYAKGSSIVECTSPNCEWSGEIFDTAFFNAEDSDDPIIDLIRDACGFDIVEKPKSRLRIPSLHLIAWFVLWIAAVVLVYVTL